MAVARQTAQSVKKPNEIVLYGVRGSPFVRKVEVALREKGVPYDFETVALFPADEGFRQISPAGRVPALRDRSVGTDGAVGTLADSSVILAYLERRFPTPMLAPTHPFSYAKALWFEEYCDSELAPVLGGGFFRPLILPLLLGQAPDVDQARTTLRERVPPLFEYVNQEIGIREYLVGVHFTVADIALTCMLMNFDLAGGVIDSGRWPALADYYVRMCRRRSLRECLAQEREALPTPPDL